MAKNQWWPTEGMIVDVESAFGHHEQKYTIEVRKWDGPLIRRVVKYKTFPPYDVGTKVKVQISDGSEVRFDPSLPGEAAIVSTMDLSDQIAEASATFAKSPGGPKFDSASKPGFGSLNVLRGEGSITFVSSSTSTGADGDQLAAGGLATGGLAATLSAAMADSSGASIQMIGPDGIQVEVNRAELSELAHVMKSGDPAARKAAIERFHQMRSAALGQASTISGGKDGTAHGIAHSDPGGQAGGSGTVKERLAKLDQLLSEGVLTQSEYDTQRERIISEI